MILAELVKTGWTVHGAFLAAAMTAWYKYSFKNDLELSLKKDLKDIRYDLLQAFSRAFSNKIRPLFQSIRAPNLVQSSEVLDTSGRPVGYTLDYGDTVRQIVDSEDFRDEILGFWVDHPDFLGDFQTLKIELPKSIACLSKALQVLLLLLIFMQAVALGGLTLKSISSVISDHVMKTGLYWSLGLTGILAFGVIAYVVLRLLIKSHTVTRYKDKYDRC